MATARPPDASYRIVRQRILELETRGGRTPDYNGVVMIDGMLLVVDYMASTAECYNGRDGTRITSHRLEGYPTDVCLINNEEVAMSLVNWSGPVVILSLMRYRHGVNLVKPLWTGFDRCYSLSKWRSDKLVVSGQKGKYDPMEYGGRMLCWRILSITDGCLDSTHDICKGLWTNMAVKDNTVYISCLTYDSINNGVHAFDLLNPDNKKFVYRHQELERPGSIMADRDYVYVCDRFSNRIHQLTDSGQLVKIHTVSSSPSSMFYDDQQGFLYTTSRDSNVITVYKMESVHQPGKPSALYDVSHPDWSPSLLLKPEKPQKATTEDCTDSMKRYNRMQQRANKKKEHVIAEALLDLHNLFSDQNMQDENNESQRCPFRLLGKLENPKVLLDHPVDAAVTRKDEGQPEVTVENIRTELQRLTTENIELKTKLNDFKYSPESFEGKEEKVRYLTGLPGFITLMKVFQLLEPFIAESSRSPLSKFEKYILVLMRLRLNLSVQDLAYRFNVSKATFSRTFINVIHVMNERMKGFILWPDREQLCMTMPMEFRKHFGLRVAIIIDCFEIFIERPSNLLARAETWSNYKHHNTVKFLIGVAPQGTVSFLSKAWGGRSSDKKITENCGILNKLLPGDLILADRGFDIAESVGLMCAEIKIPSFTKGKKQLSPLEVESTRKIAHVRIHVERVIGLVRNKYTILQDTLPIDFLLSSEGQDPLINEIVCVCCALTNLCESVVPFD